MSYIIQFTNETKGCDQPISYCSKGGFEAFFSYESFNAINSSLDRFVRDVKNRIILRLFLQTLINHITTTVTSSAIYFVDLMSLATREFSCYKPKTDQGINFLDTLPPEILFANIIGRLDYKTILLCSNLSTTWNKIANCPKLVGILRKEMKILINCNSGYNYHYNY